MNSVKLPGCRTGEPAGPGPMDSSSSYARRLALDVAVILAVKLVLLVTLWWLFFSPTHRVEVVPARVGDQLLSPEEAP